jgi:hypothetical protein
MVKNFRLVSRHPTRGLGLPERIVETIQWASKPDDCQHEYALHAVLTVM